MYVLCGQDASQVSAVLSALKRKNEAEDMPGSMAVEFDTLDDHRRIFDELYTRPFLGMEGRRMVVVRCGSELAAEAPGQLTEYASNPSSSSVLVLCCEKLDRRKNPGRKLAECAVWVDCGRISWNDARGWLHREAQRRGKKLDSAAAYALVKAVGPDIASLNGELEKLILYAGDSEIIGRQAVEDVVPDSRSRTVFDLGDAIVRCDRAEAAALGEKLLLYGESPEKVTAFLGMRMRELWKIARMARVRRPAREIARATGTPEFAIRRVEKALRGRDDRWFSSRLRILTEADNELKTSSLPARLQTVWLTDIVCRLCGADNAL